MSDFATLFAEICRPSLREVAVGDPVFNQGDQASHIFQVIGGRVRLVRHTPEGGVLTLYRAGTGETFAEAALFAEYYHCSAVVDEGGRVACFPKRELLPGLSSRPQLLLDLVAHFSAQVRRLRTLLELRSIVSAPERVMHYLRLRADPGDGRCRLPGALKDVAMELGMAHETFYRVLATLQKEGRIDREGRCIVLRSPEQKENVHAR